MITFVDKPFDIKDANATVIFGEDKHKAVSQRDRDGNITVTLDLELQPENNTPVTIVFHSENDGTYNGVLHHHDEYGMIYIPQNEHPGM